MNKPPEKKPELPTRPAEPRRTSSSSAVPTRTAGAAPRPTPAPATLDLDSERTMIRPEPAPPAPRRPSAELPRARPPSREAPLPSAADLREERTTIRPEPARPAPRPAAPAPQRTEGPPEDEAEVPHEATMILPAPPAPEPAPKRPARAATPASSALAEVERPVPAMAERARLESSADLPAAAPSRPRSRTGTRPVRSSSGDAPAPLDPALARRLKVLVTGVAVFLTLFVGYALLTSPGETPSYAELELLYPYGFQGAYGPLGEVAPAAPDVDYDFVKLVECPKGKGGGIPEPPGGPCLLYEYSGPNRFYGTMILKNTGGNWERASDEGMPFRKVTPRDAVDER